jgi:hypothetical protein
MASSFRVVVILFACFVCVWSLQETDSPRDKLLTDDNESVGRRIVGGRRASEGELPYQVGLIAGDRGLVFCGGTVIGSNWIVTAAHCITDGASLHVPVTRLRAVAGTTNHLTRSAEVLQIDQAIVHERYNSGTHVNDIALLRTRNPITRGRAAGLPTRGSRPNGAVVASGWGTTSEGGRRSYDLLAADLNILPDSYCSRIYGSRYRVPEMVCAGAMEGLRDTCQGDSGTRGRKKLCWIRKTDNYYPLLLQEGHWLSQGHWWGSRPSVGVVLDAIHPEFMFECLITSIGFSVTLNHKCNDSALVLIGHLMFLPLRSFLLLTSSHSLGNNFLL